MVAGGLATDEDSKTANDTKNDLESTQRLPETNEPTIVREALRIPGYDLFVLLGKGGMGEVWRAKQTSLQREVAVKVLSSDLASDDAFVKRFEKEAAALASLSHPHIVQIIDRGQAGKTYYFIMEFVQGQALRELMAKPLSSSDAVRIIVQVGLGGEMSVPVNALAAKELEWRGTFRFHEEFAVGVDLLNKGLIDVKPLISASLPYRDATRAFKLASDRSQAMKVLLSFK